MSTNSQNPQNGSRYNSRSREGSEGKSYRDVATKAVHKEADVKQDMGPSVSMTIVGEHVEVTQHFHF